MLEIDQIDVFYEDLQALWGTSLTLKEGEILALVGSNGAGKSTLLKTISGLLRPANGRITLNGRQIDREPANKIVDLGICLVPEGKRLFPQMSVLENLEIGAFISRARQVRDETMIKVYDIFPILKERKNQLAGSLSGGEQQMLAIGRGLMSQPKILLLDEVSLGLAPIVVEEVFDAIKTINESGVTVLLIEQNVSLALEVSDRGYIIENGRITGEGESQSLISDEQVKKAFLG